MNSEWKVLTFAITLLSASCGSSPSASGGSDSASPTAGGGGLGLGNGGAIATNTTPSSTAGAAGRAGSVATANAAAGRSGGAGTKLTGTGGSGKLSSQGGLSGGTIGSSGAGGADVTPETPSDGTFPPVTDVWARGPFTLATKTGAGPNRDATVFYPREIGENGAKHPIVTWGNGKGQTGTAFYASITQHVATHGFVVYTSYQSSDQGTELKEGLDWMIAENNRSGSEFYQKLDTTKSASMGHSQGSIATYAISGDPRMTTTIHLSGGTNPDLATGHEPLAGLHAPVMFICGENIAGGDGLMVGDVASQWCQYDFENVKVPVFFAVIKGASHITAPGQTTGALVGWLRWRLTGDTNIKRMFIGTDCDLCKRDGWVVQQRDLE
jgi:hypothetical protein